MTRSFSSSCLMSAAVNFLSTGLSLSSGVSVSHPRRATEPMLMPSSLSTTTRSLNESSSSLALKQYVFPAVGKRMPTILAM